MSTSTTPYADAFVGRGEDALRAELRRLRLVEADCLHRQEEAELKLEEERHKLHLQWKHRLAEVELMEKSISYFQFKTTLSSFIDGKLVREAETAQLCHRVLHCFIEFQHSPGGRLADMLSEEADEDDGQVSAALLHLCQVLASSQRSKSASNKREDVVLASEQLGRWIETRLELRMSQFEVARRSQHIPLMQQHANYLTRHGQQGDLFCVFLAELALRPLLFQHQPCASQQQLHFVFDQTRAQIGQIKHQVFANLHLDRFVGRFELALYTALFPARQRTTSTATSEGGGGGGGGLFALVRDWIHVVGEELKLDLLVECKRRALLLLRNDIGGGGGGDRFSALPLQRIFPAKDYYMLELSQLQAVGGGGGGAASVDDELAQHASIDEFIQQRAEPLVRDFAAQLTLAVTRARTYLSTSEFQTSCFETFSSFACMRIINQLCLPVLRWFEDMHEENEEDEEDGATAANSEGLRACFCATVVPFMELCCDTLLDLFSSQINSKLLVEQKVALVESELERLHRLQVDCVFAAAAPPPFRELVKAMPAHAKRVRPFGAGASLNLLRRFKDAVFDECLLHRQTNTLERGEALAIELHTIASNLVGGTFVFEAGEFEKRALRVQHELKQLGNVFALPKLALNLDALDLVNQDARVQQFVANRRY